MSAYGGKADATRNDSLIKNARLWPDLRRDARSSSRKKEAAIRGGFLPTSQTGTEELLQLGRDVVELGVKV